MINNKNSESCFRNYSADLLRIVLIIFIVIHHSLVHGMGLSSLKNGYKVPAEVNNIYYFVLNALCIVGVNGFFWLSGYFSIKTKYKKLFYLYLECIFYMGVFQLANMLIWRESISIKLITIPILDYWFMGVYFFIALVAPFINIAISALSIKQRWKLLITLVALNTIYGFLFDMNGIGNGYTAIQGIIMYTIGRICFENKDVILKEIKKKLFLVVYFGCGLIVGGTAYFLAEFRKYNWAWKMYAYNNPIVICSAVSIGMYFVSSNLKVNSFTKTLSSIGRCSLAVYLLTDNYIIKNRVFIPLKMIIANQSILFAIPVVVIYSVFLCCITILIDKVCGFLVSLVKIKR